MCLPFAFLIYFYYCHFALFLLIVQCFHASIPPFPHCLSVHVVSVEWKGLWVCGACRLFAVCWIWISPSLGNFPLILGWSPHVSMSWWLCVHSLSHIFCRFCLCSHLFHAPLQFHMPTVLPSSHCTPTAGPADRQRYFWRYQHLCLFGLVYSLMQNGYSH